MLDQLCLASITLSGSICGWTLCQQTGITPTTPVSLSLLIASAIGFSSFAVMQYANRRDIRIIKRYVLSLPCVNRNRHPKLGKTECGEDIESIEDLELELSKK